MAEYRQEYAEGGQGWPRVCRAWPRVAESVPRVCRELPSVAVSLSGVFGGVRKHSVTGFNPGHSNLYEDDPATLRNTPGTAQ